MRTFVLLLAFFAGVSAVEAGPVPRGRSKRSRQGMRVPRASWRQKARQPRFEVADARTRARAFRPEVDGGRTGRETYRLRGTQLRRYLNRRRALRRLQQRRETAPEVVISSLEQLGTASDHEPLFPQAKKPRVVREWEGMFLIIGGQDIGVEESQYERVVASIEQGEMGAGWSTEDAAMLVLTQLDAAVEEKNPERPTFEMRRVGPVTEVYIPDVSVVRGKKRTRPSLRNPRERALYRAWSRVALEELMHAASFGIRKDSGDGGARAVMYSPRARKFEQWLRTLPFAELLPLNMELGIYRNQIQLLGQMPEVDVYAFAEENGGALPVAYMGNYDARILFDHWAKHIDGQ